MKYLLIFSLCFGMTSAFAQHDHQSKMAAVEKQGNKQTQCPVLGGGISKSVYTDYKGKRVYFCCAGCVDEFKKNPEKYLKKMKDQGIVLEDTPKK